MKTIFKSGFARNVATVVSGTAAAQLITIFASPFLTRLFTPKDFGIFAVFMSIAGILAVIFTFQYDMAIILPKKESDAESLLGIAINLSERTFFTAFILLALGIFAIEKTGGAVIPSYALLLGVISAFFLAINRTLNYWNIRRKRFRLITFSQIMGVAVATAFQLITGVLSLSAWALLVGVIIGYIVNISIQLNPGPNKLAFSSSIRSVSDEPQRKFVLRKYSDFPKYRMPQILVNSISQYLPTMMLAYLFGPATGGLYALAQRVVKLPGMLVSEAIRKVYYQKASEIDHKNKNLFDPTLKMTLSLALIGLLPFGIIIVAAPHLFSFIFGEQWYSAGTYAVWLTLWIYFSFCNVPSVTVIPIIKMQKQFLIFEIFSLIIRVSSIFFGAISRNPLVTIILYSVVGSILNVGLIIWVHIRLRLFNFVLSKS